MRAVVGKPPQLPPARAPQRVTGRPALILGVFAVIAIVVCCAVSCNGGQDNAAGDSPATVAPSRVLAVQVPIVESRSPGGM